MPYIEFQVNNCQLEERIQKTEEKPTSAPTVYHRFSSRVGNWLNTLGKRSGQTGQSGEPNKP